MAAFMGGALVTDIPVLNGLMDYSNTNIADLYQHTKYEYNNEKDTVVYRARAWIMAENIMEVRNLVIDWCKSLDDGSIKYRLPNPLGDLTQRQADKIILILDDEFDMEFRTRSAGLGLTAQTDLTNRLEPQQRLAMAQAIKSVKKSKIQIAREARKRLDAGESLPPKGWVMQHYSGYGMLG